MPDAARVAQAHALDVPIVLRGAKKSADPEKPELFTETARTVLVFDNGAVLHLHSKLVVGQTVYIHNTQNGREVLCKVLEAPGEGELGLTDLEFTTAMPDFWGITLGGDSAARAPQAGATAADPGAPNGDSSEQARMREPSGKPADDPLAMMLETASKIDVPSMSTPGKESGVPLHEELMSAHEVAPDPSAIPVPMPDFHLAYYDHLLRLDADGRWWFEALVTDERRPALDESLDLPRCALICSRILYDLPFPLTEFR